MLNGVELPILHLRRVLLTRPPSGVLVRLLLALGLICALTLLLGPAAGSAAGGADTTATDDEYFDKLRATARLALLLLLPLGLLLVARWAWTERARRRGDSRWSSGSPQAPSTLLHYLRARAPELLALVVLYGVSMLAIPYWAFMDEYDNMLGGLQILQGRLPNAGYFTQHMPLTYYVAALIALIAHNDIWTFRALFLFAMYLWGVANYLLFRAYVGKLAGLLYFALVALSMTMYWGHMVLAETLAAYATVSLALLFLFKFPGEALVTTRDTLVVSILVAVTVLTSLAFVYLAGFLYFALGIKLLQRLRARPSVVQVLTSLALVPAPYLTITLPIVLAGGIRTFVFENYTFNVWYYWPYSNVPASLIGGAMAILHNGALVVGEVTRHPEVVDATFSLVAVGALLVYWATRSAYANVGFFLPVVLLSYTRGEPTGAWAENFHAIPYILLTIMAGSIVIPELFRRGPAGPRQLPLKTCAAVAAALMLLASAKALGFLASNAYAYASRPPFPVDTIWPGQGPVNVTSWRPTRDALVLNDLTTPDDYVWVGPVEYETLLYLHARPASHYPVLVPWIHDCGSCEERLFDEFSTNQPKIVVWHPGFNAWGTDEDHSAMRVLRYITERYFVVEQSRDDTLRDFHFLKQRRSSILEELRSKGYLQGGQEA